MLEVTSDLHLHSHFSRAVSPQMNLRTMQEMAIKKGLDILATGDWTHPLWLKELEKELEEEGEGVFRLKFPISNSKFQISNVIPSKEGIHSDNILDPGSSPGMTNDVRFLLSTEIATIFSQKGKGRRVHQLVFVPSFETAEKVNKELLKRGCNLTADGRPMIGLSSKELLELILEIDERSLLIPAHIWTPWFGVYGQKSGFDSLEEAYEDLAPFVYGIETGLSSDPEMNWQIKELQTRSILSFSDAHSLPKMGREATVFGLESLTYANLRKAIMQPSVADSQDQNKVLYTTEFYPEEGKYHYSGHRKCHVTMTPDQQQAAHNICPVCGRTLTDGVMRRLQEVADEKTEGVRLLQKQVVWIEDPKKLHPPFVKLVPLQEIIAEAMERPFTSPKVLEVYTHLTQTLGNELAILLKVPLERLSTSLVDTRLGEKLAEGVKRVRQEDIVVRPGYDAVYGKVAIWQDTASEGSQLNMDW